MADSPRSPTLYNRIFGRGVSSSADPRAFLQERVALYLKIQWLLLGSFYAVDATVALVERRAGGLLQLGLLLHLALVLAIFGAWVFARSAERSTTILEIIEATGTLAICATAVAMLAMFPIEAVESGPAFAVAFAIVARAAIVPSSGRRSFLIGLIASATVTFGYWNRGRGSEPGPDFVLLWTLAFALVSALVSRVIYGLQQQVQEARQLGQYVLEDKLGEGGMGAVYRAHHAMLRRDTAVKLLLPERIGIESLARFEREVRQTARLSHPNTITIFDYGRTPDGTFYYAMELLDGANLDEIVAVGGPLPAERVAHALSAVAGALAEAHEIGLIHRDIKPANIILCRQGGVLDVPKVVDFGLVKQLDAGDDAAHRTNANSILGTPHYMSPESITTPDTIDGRSDLYALGAVGYYLLTGEHVFSGETVVEVCLKHLDAMPIAPSERLGARVPPLLERVVLDCLEKDAARRPQTALELLERLRDTGTATWDARLARAWWADHAAELKARRSIRPSLGGSARTLAIDPARRS